MASSRVNSDKENVHRTRIPLPKDPLPALPKHLLNNKKLHNQENLQQRGPLKTINSQTIPKAGPSKVVPNKPKHPLKIDTKHVTMRLKREDLDWHYKIFEDKRVNRDADVISISDDESYLDDKEGQKYFVENKNKNTLGEVLRAVTPSVKANLEPNRVRNIKRSLKRPHSRELQGLSPAAKPENFDDRVKRRLQFNERSQDKLVSPDYWSVAYMRCCNRDYTIDVFNYLLSAERKPLGVPRTSNTTRACVINWLMKVNGADGNPAIVQSACWYLDSILGTSQVYLDKLQLVAAACFWIAQKLNGPVLSAMRLVKCSNKAFTSDKLLAAEKAVLSRLEFPQQPIVAQDFITYFSWWCDTKGYPEIATAATFLAMSGLMVDRVLCKELPSVIAVAAVHTALQLLKKQDLILRLDGCSTYIVAEGKTTQLPYLYAVLRRAVRTVADPIYEYKAPFDHFGIPPSYIAQRIVSAANEFAVMDNRILETRINT